MKAAVGLAAVLLLASACQRPASEATPSPDGTAWSPAPSETAAAGVFAQAQIIGTWRPYSRGTDLEFGSLEITDSRISLANFGSADYQLRGRYAVLTWREFYSEARILCGNAPPELLEFELEDKREILAAGTPGQWLSVSFFETAAAIGTDRSTSTELCRVSTWSR